MSGLVEVADQLAISFEDRDVAIGGSSDPVIIIADFEVEVIEVPEQGPPGPMGPVSTTPGPPGPQGPQGYPGANGNTIIYGTTNPTPEIGTNGDSYINKTTSMLFGPKAGGSWPTGTSLIGPQGPQGIKGDKGDKGDQGLQGIQGPQGADGNTVLYGTADPLAAIGINGNFYINQTTSMLFGPKAAGAWPAGVSMIGPQGPVGPAGGILEAPTDGTVYGRKNAAWVANVATGAVRYDTAQALSTAERAQARGNVAAAPFDALAYNGIQLNGAMEVSQEIGSAGVVLPNSVVKNIVDGWGCYYICATGSITASQVDVAGYFGGQPAGFGNALVMNPTVGVPCSNNGEYAIFRHKVEGQRLARLAWGTASAQPLSYGFWFYSNIAGTMFLKLQNASSTRFYYQEHVVAGGWNFLSGTIPGDTTGTWPAATGLALYFDVMVAGKSAAIGPTAGAWSATDAVRTANNTNLIISNANIVGITGFVLLPGIELPSSARLPFIKRRFDQEEFDAQRYLYVLAPNAAGAEAASGIMSQPTQAYFLVPFPRRMRATPSMSISAVGDWQIEPFQSGSTNQIATAFQAANITPISFRAGFTCASTGASSGMAGMLMTAGINAKIIADARL